MEIKDLIEIIATIIGAFLFSQKYIDDKFKEINTKISDLAHHCDRRDDEQEALSQRILAVQRADTKPKIVQIVIGGSKPDEQNL